MNAIMYVLYILLLVMLYYNMRTKTKKVAVINILLALVTIILTVIYNGSFILKCINNYQYEVETISDYEKINLGGSWFPYQLYFIVLWLISIVYTSVKGIIIIVKKKKNYSQIIKGIISIMLIAALQTIFIESLKIGSRNNIPIAYEDGMIEKDIIRVKFLINLGIYTNILATNLFILINFKNKKENVSDVKGENS